MAGSVISTNNAKTPLTKSNDIILINDSKTIKFFLISHHLCFQPIYTIYTLYKKRRKK